MKRWLLPFLPWLIISTAHGAFAEWHVPVTVHVFQIPEGRAWDLIPRLAKDHTAAEAFRELEQDVEQHRAAKLHQLKLHAAPGGAASASEGEELMRPSYEQDGLILAVASPFPLGPLAMSYPIRSFMPRGFGFRIEAEAAADPSGLSLQFASEWDTVTAAERWETSVDRFGVHRYFEQKRFPQWRIETRFPLGEKTPILLGARMSPEKKGMMDLQILTHRSRQLTSPPPEKATPETARRVFLESQTFRLSQTDALELRPRLLSTAEVEPAHAQLMEWIRTGRAVLLTYHASLAGNKEQMHLGESEEQWIPAFPVSHGTVPQAYLATLQHDEATLTLARVPLTVRRSLYELPNHMDWNTVWTGMELEVNIVNRDIHVQGGMSLEQLVGYHCWGSLVGEPGRVNFIYCPIKISQRCVVNATLADGQRILLHFRQDPKSEHVDLTLLRASFTAP